MVMKDGQLPSVAMMSFFSPHSARHATGRPPCPLVSASIVEVHATQPGPRGDAIRYLNTYLDLASERDLTVLVEELSRRGMSLHSVRHDRNKWIAQLEMEECLETPALAIAAMLEVIDSLPGPSKTSWAACTRRLFNLGYDCGSWPSPFEQSLSNKILARVAAIGADLAVTLYPAMLNER